MKRIKVRHKETEELGKETGKMKCSEEEMEKKRTKNRRKE